MLRSGTASKGSDRELWRSFGPERKTDTKLIKEQAYISSILVIASHEVINRRAAADPIHKSLVSSIHTFIPIYPYRKSSLQFLV